MRPQAIVFLISTIAICAAAAWFGAGWAVMTLERDTSKRITTSLAAAGQDWAQIETDGLIVKLSGTAPTESGRFKALEVTAQIVDTNRIEDTTTVQTKGQDINADFVLEILRNGQEMSLIGLIPGKDSRLAILRRVAGLKNDASFTDLMESVEFAAPDGWPAALDFALTQAALLDKSRTIVRPGGVTIEAFLASQQDLEQVRQRLSDAKVEGIDIKFMLSAPKEIVAPFRFMAMITDGSLEIRECWSDSEEGRAKIYTAFSDYGSDAKCAEALGSPSPEWADGIVAALATLNELGSGSVEISDTDIVFGAPDTTDLEVFETAVNGLQDALPEIFSLTLKPPQQGDDNSTAIVIDPIFSAELSAEDGLAISGPMRDTASKVATENFAAARFGHSQVTPSLTVVGNIPVGWSPKVLAALDAMSLMHEGSLTLTREQLEITGKTQHEDAAQIMREIVGGRLGEVKFSPQVTFDPELLNAAGEIGVNAKECERQLAAIMREAQIIFDPSSSTISDESELVLDQIAFIVSSCPDAHFEIGGHTDSQGGDQMNLNLSQARAESVLDTLLAREVLLDQISAKGYGETVPIADNETEEGRARNRRIAFKLLPREEASDE